MISTSLCLLFICLQMWSQLVKRKSPRILLKDSLASPSVTHLWQRVSLLWTVPLSCETIWHLLILSGITTHRLLRPSLSLLPVMFHRMFTLWHITHLWAPLERSTSRFVNNRLRYVLSNFEQLNPWQTVVKVDPSSCLQVESICHDSFVHCEGFLSSIHRLLQKEIIIVSRTKDLNKIFLTTTKTKRGRKSCPRILLSPFFVCSLCSLSFHSFAASWTVQRKVLHRLAEDHLRPKKKDSRLKMLLYSPPLFEFFVLTFLFCVSFTLTSSPSPTVQGSSFTPSNSIPAVSLLVRGNSLNFINTTSSTITRDFTIVPLLQGNSSSLNHSKGSGKGHDPNSNNTSLHSRPKTSGNYHPLLTPKRGGGSNSSTSSTQSPSSFSTSIEPRSYFSTYSSSSPATTISSSQSTDFEASPSPSPTETPTADDDETGSGRLGESRHFHSLSFNNIEHDISNYEIFPPLSSTMHRQQTSERRTEV